MIFPFLIISCDGTQPGGDWAPPAALAGYVTRAVRRKSGTKFRTKTSQVKFFRVPPFLHGTLTEPTSAQRSTVCRRDGRLPPAGELPVRADRPLLGMRRPPGQATVHMGPAVTALRPAGRGFAGRQVQKQHIRRQKNGKLFLFLLSFFLISLLLHTAHRASRLFVRRRSPQTEGSAGGRANPPPGPPAGANKRAVQV